ncbi:hypothetical protein HMPREF0208_01599 [Citrobacter koseri]|nr:hypothetical protein HMPREF3220_04037 [Citrobacter koseri]KXA05253.1 hypothetical protein HMPREF3207_00915 [Citrobacter koseri]KXB45033.1 hypothetical protein HMPREF0208_01599 [Citrobacter koseri]
MSPFGDTNNLLMSAFPDTFMVDGRAKKSSLHGSFLAGWRLRLIRPTAYVQAR